MGFSTALVAATESSELPALSFDGKPCDLSQWVLVGPFPLAASTARSSPAKPATIAASLEECREQLGDFPFISEQLPREAIRWARMQDSGMVLVNGALGFDRNQSLRGTASVAYANIRAVADTASFAAIGCEDEVELFLNGALIGTLAKSSAFAQGQNLVALQLRAGSNLLAVRMKHASATGPLSIRLFATEKAAEDFARSKRAVSLQEVMPELNSTLAVAVKGWNPTLEKIALVTAEEQVRKEIAVEKTASAANLPLDGVPADLYRVRAQFEDGQTVLSDFVCVGDATQVYENLARRPRPAKLAENPDFLAIMRRWEILNQPEARDSTDNERKRKVIFILREYAEILGRDPDPQGVFTAKPGIHILGFTSGIDGQVQFYRVFFPRRVAAAQPIPLVVILPTVVSSERPFIESPFIAHQLETEIAAGVAEEQGVALLWPGYRGQPWANPIDLAHLTEVYADLAHRLTIDPHRVYLYGGCSGGMLALGELVYRPRFYTAAYLRDAFFHRQTNRYAERDPFTAWPDYQKWIAAADPAAEFLRTRNSTPLRIVNDNNSEPGHGELRFAEEFVREARRFEIVPVAEWKSGVIFHNVEFEQMVRWFLRQQRGDPSDECVNWPRTNDGPGPIAKAFAKPFVVVEGTQGSAAQRSANRAITQRFQEAWSRNQFAGCRVVPDTEVTAEMRTTVNLVLIGNAETNLVWQAIDDRLPFKVSSTAITYGAHRWSKSSSALQAVVESPWNPSRQIVLLGGCDLKSARFGTLELAMDGWYDFAIWETERLIPKLVVAERLK